MGTLIHKVGHGLVADDTIMFGNLVGGEGLEENTLYYVLAAGLTADDFAVSSTPGGVEAEFTTDIEDGVIVTADSYEPDTEGPHSEPDPVPAPAAPTLSSALVSGVVRLRVVLNDVAEAKVRAWEVDITHKFDGPDADWNTPLTHTLPGGSTELSIPCLGSTVYAVRVRSQDVYGQYSEYCADTLTTTEAGDDSLAASIAALANDVQDGIITETKIADNAISTPKLQAGAVTADILAATIVLASLIKTADTGRRIEVDVDGIRLYDTDESLLMRIPTNGDPVYIKGQVTADSLISQTSATFRTAVSLEGSGVMTLQNGIAVPSNVPTLAASVDSLTLSGTALPASALGLGYDAAAGTFWLACDPSTGYVAYEYNATTGAYVRRIPATGSTTTTTTTLGSTSHVTDTADGVVGSTNSHFAVPLTMPRDGRITKVAAYLAGRSGSATCRNGIWTDVSGTGNAARYSDVYTASSGGATTLGASDLYNKTLTSPYTVSDGQTIYAGFYHNDSGEGIQFDKDDGAGKTTYSGDGTDADGSGWGTYDSAGKPNVYITYEYDTDTRLETAAMIGVCTDGTYVYTLDTNGVVWKYDRSTMAHVAHSSVQTAITGTKSKAGLFYDATAGELIITTSTGTGAGVYPKFVRVVPSTLAVSVSVYSAAAGTTFSGTTDTFRGGARLADPLNASAATYWVATTSAVYAYTFTGSTATQTSNRDFGLSTTVGDGLAHDGTQFRGFDAASPTKVWKFSAWDWTSASALYWVGYSWYDSVGTTHETALGPRASVTMRRRERLTVTSAAIPTGGVDDPDKVRIYMAPNASEPAAGSYKLQATDALTSRTLVTYTSGGAADGIGTAFAAGTPAELKSSATGWSLKGDGSVTISASTPIGGKPPVQRLYTTSGSPHTWTKPAGLVALLVEVQGGGGGGGGCGNPSASETAVAAGGGGGGYARYMYSAAELAGASTGTITVGGAGTAGTTTPTSGGTGGTTTFALTGATSLVGSGGGGGGNGPVGTTNGVTDGGAGGGASGPTGAVVITGSDGRNGIRADGLRMASQGDGGGSTLGGVARSNGSATEATGSTGQAYGGGGGGAYSKSADAHNGGPGAAGCCIVTEYYGA